VRDRARCGHDTPRGAEQQRQRVVGDLVEAVVRHVGHEDARPCGGFDVDVVDPDPVAGDDPAALGGRDRRGRHLGEAHEQRVRPGQRGRVLGQRRADLRQSRAFGFQVTEDVIGDQDLSRARHRRTGAW
jgi:hypothetical protein